MRRYSDSVNMVNAPHLARERWLDIREVRHDREGDYHTLVRVTVATEAVDRSVAGTLFGNNEPRLVAMFGLKVEVDHDGDMLDIFHADAQGFSGRIVGAVGGGGAHLGTCPSKGR